MTIINDIDGDGVLTCADVNIEFDALGWAGTECGGCTINNATFCNAGVKGFFDGEQWDAHLETLTPICRTDADGDYWMDANPTSSSAVPGMDCVDSDATINPYVVDEAGDGIDSNCDGLD